MYLIDNFLWITNNLRECRLMERSYWGQLEYELKHNFIFGWEFSLTRSKGSECIIKIILTISVWRFILAEYFIKLTVELTVDLCLISFYISIFSFLILIVWVFTLAKSSINDVNERFPI